MNIVFDFAESRETVYIFGPVRADQSPPAHVLEPLGPLPAVGRGQLAGGAGVISEQREERLERPVAAAQLEEQVAQLDANAGGPVLAPVAQGEEDVRLEAVSAPNRGNAAVRSGSFKLLRVLLGYLIRKVPSGWCASSR